MLRKKFQEIKAFTLIELMIVIAIIMILAAIIIPNVLVFVSGGTETQQVEIIDQSQELQLKSNTPTETSNEGGTNNKL